MRTSRRRFVRITAAAGVFGASPETLADVPAVRWRGRALGARASITLCHPERGQARRILERCVAEIRRLEAIFSLYRPESAISRLNAGGRLDHPPFELLDLLSQARAVSEASAGAFDLTVQPLWHLHAVHFASPGAAPSGPDPRAVEDAKARVDHRGIDMDPRHIRFAKAGMAITANGIAQGYITDRIADRLREAGAEHVLVDLGEIRAIGVRGDGERWRVGVGDRTLELADRAIATSDPGGTTFAADARLHHLLDPRTGRPAAHARRVSVVAPTATLADGLSTALAIMGPATAAPLLAAFPDAAEA